MVVEVHEWLLGQEEQAIMNIGIGRIYMQIDCVRCRDNPIIQKTQ